MNERIRELADQADATVLGTMTGGKQYTFLEHDLEKFAELIVRECCEVVKWTPSQFSNDEYVKNIQEHFGVEE